jgi:hypothetical protein
VRLAIIQTILRTLAALLRCRGSSESRRQPTGPQPALHHPTVGCGAEALFVGYPADMPEMPISGYLDEGLFLKTMNGGSFRMSAGSLPRHTWML